MLDAYIIDRIRREQEQARNTDRRQPLQVPIQRERPPGAPEEEADRDRAPTPGEERGSVVIDYSLRAGRSVDARPRSG